jgi:hypothetical protein
MKNNKLFYNAPVIELVALDHEKSLALSSEPPEGPNEGFNKTPVFFNQEASLKA